MKRSRRSSRALIAGLSLTALVAGLGAPGASAAPSTPAAPQAPAAPAAFDPARPFSAAANASLLKLDLGAVAGTPAALLPLTRVDIANSSVAADSDGDVSDDETGNQRTGAAASTLGQTTLLGAPLNLSSNVATAPPSESNEDVLLPLNLAPIATLPLVRTTATANWISDTECVSSDEPLSFADQTLADLDLLGLGGAQSVASIEPDPTDGAIDTEVATALPSNGQPNDGRNVQASVATRLAGLNVLNGILGAGSLIEVRVLQNANYTAVASGTPGGAQIIGEDPIVQLLIGGNVVAQVTAGQAPAEEALIDLGLTDLFGALDPLLALVQPVVRVSVPLTKNVAADGTSASVSGALLHLEILTPQPTGPLAPVLELLTDLLANLGLDFTQPLLSLDLAPFSASATAPAGGLFCGTDDTNPLEVQKVNSGPAIPGSTFDYTIAVGNVGDCTLNPVRVEDTLLGPAGTTIVSTEPAGAQVSPVNGGFRVVWDNVGPIAPDGRTTLRIRVSVPANAQIGSNYSDTVTSSATCDGRPVTRTDQIDEPHVISPPGGPCNINGSNKAKSHTEVYPGESFVYFINVFNAGGEACTDAVVTDAIDPRLTFEACSDSCTVDGRNVRWNLGTLAPGQSLTLRLQVKVNLGATGELANAAVIDTAQTPEKPVQVTGPQITTNSVLDRNSPASVPNLARTGGSMPLSVAGILGLLALGFAAVRRRILPV